jgi:hypothetical protein
MGSVRSYDTGIPCLIAVWYYKPATQYATFVPPNGKAQRKANDYPLYLTSFNQAEGVVYYRYYFH